VNTLTYPVAAYAISVALIIGYGAVLVIRIARAQRKT